MIVRPIKTRIFKEGEKLIPFITRYVPSLKERSILVVTSKIVALSQGRVTATGDEKLKERIIRKESQWAIKTKWTWLTVKDNAVLSSAGIDESNADGKLILLPIDSFGVASRLRIALRKKYKIKKLGILITDSRLLPLRAGVVAIAVGYAGFGGIRDDRGKLDLFGRKLTMTRVDLADGLATTAALLMGEAAEQQPLAVIEGAPVQFADRINKNELVMDFREDVYAPLFQNLKKIKIKQIKSPW